MPYLLLVLLFSSTLHAEELCDNKNKKNLTELAAILSSDLAPECQAPMPGAFKDVNISRYGSLTRVEQIYRLKRTDDGNFEVTFNVSFYKDTGASFSQMNDPSLTTKWREIAKNCLQKTDGKARGPNGELVTFKIYEGPNNESSPPGKLIGVRTSGRAHSSSWTDDLNCTGVFHELLHLTGLVDEYPEREMGYVQDPKTSAWTFVNTKPERIAFDCRKIYDKNSIMANSALAWAVETSNLDLRVDLCSCIQSDGCTRYFDEKKKQAEEYFKKAYFQDQKFNYPNQCPAGFKKSEHNMEFPIADDIKKQFDDGKPIGLPIPEGLSFEDIQKMPQAYTIKQRSSGNLLDPRHFNAIIFPGCLSKNHVYYQDSMNSYRTSRQNGGIGCGDLSWSGR